MTLPHRIKAYFCIQTNSYHSRRVNLFSGIKTSAPAVAIAAAATLSSCFTGIESTPKITDTDVRRDRVVANTETGFLNDVVPEPAADWTTGKRFFVTDNKISSILTSDDPSTEKLAGKILTYAGSRPFTSIVGARDTEYFFVTPEGNRLRYRPIDSSVSDTMPLEVPFTVQLSVVDEVGKRLKGNTYYILTPIWYDRRGESFNGRKFIPVTVEEVLPGSSIYPIRLVLRAPEGGLFELFMSTGANLKAPRGFDKLLSFTDPRKKYPHITDEVWNNIITGRVAIGMTRDECRLSLGSPDNVVHRTGSSYLYETWTYTNGIYLAFRDGILESYRR